MARILRLALPIALTSLGLMTMGLVDLIFVGRVGTTATGAVGIGTSFFSWAMIFGIGLLAGMDYLVASAFGAGRLEDCRQTWRAGLRLSFWLSLPMTAVLYFGSYHLEIFHLNAAVAPEAASYLRILSWSIWPVYVFTASRNYLQAVNQPTPPTIVLIVANVLNAVMNYAFIYGHWGAPRMLVPGSAVATVVSRVWMMAALTLYAYYWNRRNIQVPPTFTREEKRARLKALLELGFPAAGQMTLEVGVFATSTALAGTLDPVALAAHQIVLNIASVTFMVPFGLGAATAVVVGHALGRGDKVEARAMGWRGLFIGSGFMACASVFILLFASAVLGIYTTDAAVIHTCISLLLIAGLFQLSDGIQTVATGALRGAADTRTPMIANLFGHWVFGLPLGAVLCFYLGYGVQGLWIGLAVGLTAVAGWLLVTWSQLTKSWAA